MTLLDLTLNLMTLLDLTFIYVTFVTIMIVQDTDCETELKNLYPSKCQSSALSTSLV